MQVAIRGKNIEITPALRDYVEKKITKITKFIDLPVTAQVNLYVERERHIAEVTAAMNGIILRGEESTSDMYASIDLVSDKLEKQVHKYKGKFKKRTKDSKEVESEAEVASEPEGVLVKTKRFGGKPLSIDEAIMQLNLLSHDFFVFVNSDTHRVNVLYRRKDANYGLLDPEF